MNDFGNHIELNAMNTLLTKRTEELNRKAETTNSNNLSDIEKRKFAEVSRGFEAMFVNMMLKEMKSALLENKDSEYSAPLQEYSDMLFAEQISDQGKGIGIAEKVYQFLTGEDLPIARIISQPKPVVEIQPKQRPERKTAEVAQNLEKVAPTRELNKGNFLDRVKNRIEVYDNIINAASERFGIKPEMIKAVITAESAGHNYAKSKAGAKGLMQLMDGTARDLGVTDSFDPAQNIFGGARYLKQMLDKFGNNQELALAAYNAGPGNVQKYGGIPPFKETQGYIKKVNKYLQQFLTENIENQGI